MRIYRGLEGIRRVLVSQVERSRDSEFGMLRDFRRGVSGFQDVELRASGEISFIWI